MALVLERLAEVGRAAVLPDDGALEGRARLAVEADRCFSLVGDADRDDLVTGVATRRGDVSERRHGEAGDLFGVVLDLPGRGEELGELSVGLVEDLQTGAKGDGPHARRAGVEGEHEVHPGHATQARTHDFRP